mgnify:CR=1 FL=1
MTASPNAANPAHPVIVRITHWLNAIAIIIMILSGWRIYNAAPLFDFRFPNGITLGGWLAGGIAWHFAAMWLLVFNGLIYLIYGCVSGHFRQAMLPIRPTEIWRDTLLALTFRLEHRPGHYNAVQRLMYAGVWLLIVLVIASGLAIWKPVQLQELASLFGGYEGARLVHFLAMSGIVAFIFVHLALVALVPKTLLPMIFGHGDKEAQQ